MRKTAGNYKRRKQGGTDRYGTYRDGRLITPEFIAGRTIDRQLPSYLTR